jgi:hypothetical protein
MDSVPITLPYRFDTSGVWHTILKGAFALNAVLLLGFAYSLVAGPWTKAVAVAVFEAVVFAFTRVFMRFQDGSVGVLSPDSVVIAPNVLFGVPLPGPRGTYALDRFSAVRVEFRTGVVQPDAQDTGPHEVVSLVGRPGTPDVVLARTSDRAGRAVGQELGALLRLPVEEVGAPIEIRL